MQIKIQKIDFFKCEGLILRKLDFLFFIRLINLYFYPRQEYDSPMTEMAKKELSDNEGN